MTRVYKKRKVSDVRKYNQDGVSYIKAAGNKHTYFDLGDKGWNEALNKVGESNMWEINKKFLK